MKRLITAYSPVKGLGFLKTPYSLLSNTSIPGNVPNSKNLSVAHQPVETCEIYSFFGC
jgi:hypothetical protein